MMYIKELKHLNLNIIPEIHQVSVAFFCFWIHFLALFLLPLSSAYSAPRLENPLESHGILNPSGDSYEKYENGSDPNVRNWIKINNDRTRKSLLSLNTTNRFSYFKTRIDRFTDKNSLRYNSNSNGLYNWTIKQNNEHPLGYLMIAPFGEDNFEKYKPAIDLDALAEAEGFDSYITDIQCHEKDPYICILKVSRNGMDRESLRIIDMKNYRLYPYFTTDQYIENSGWLTENIYYVYTEISEEHVQPTFYSKNDHGNILVLEDDNPLKLKSAARIVKYGFTKLNNKSVPYVMRYFSDSEDCSLSYSFLGANIKEFCLPPGSLFLGFFGDFIIFKFFDDNQQLGAKKSNVYAVSRFTKDSQDTNKWYPLFEKKFNTSIKSLDFTLNSIILQYEINNGVDRDLVAKRFVINENKIIDDGSINLTGPDFSIYLSISPLSDSIELGNTSLLEDQKRFKISIDAPFVLPKEWIERRESLPKFFRQTYVANSIDGIVIPYTVYSNQPIGNVLNPKPTILYVYGGHGKTVLNPLAKPELSAWIQSGGLVIVPRVRGGGFYGETWQQHGEGLLKQKTYDDIESVAKEAILKNLTSRSQIGIMGGSSGGLASAVTTIQNPHLFKASVIASAPLDLDRYIKGLGGATYWQETYGNSVTDRHSMLLRSPYHLSSESLPKLNLLVLSNSYDDRVHPGHSRKFAVKLQDFGQQGVLFFEEDRRGHSYNRLNQVKIASELIFSFFAAQLGLK